MKAGHSLIVAIAASIGVLLLFVGVQVASFLVVQAFILGSAGLKIALSTLMASLIMFGLTIWVATMFGNSKKLLGLKKFNKKYLTGSLGLLMVFLLASSLLENYGQHSLMDFMDELIDSSSFGLFFVLVVVIAPIYEEFVFRGLIMGVILEANTSLSTKIRWLIASLVAAVGFTAVHLQYDWFGLVLIFILSLILSWARLISQSVILPIILHFINNSLAMIVYLLT